MPRPVPQHDRDAGGPAEVLAAKAELRQQVWSGGPAPAIDWADLTEAKIAAIPLLTALRPVD